MRYRQRNIETNRETDGTRASMAVGGVVARAARCGCLLQGPRVGPAPGGAEVATLVTRVMPAQSLRGTSTAGITRAMDSGPPGVTRGSRGTPVPPRGQRTAGATRAGAYWLGGEGRRIGGEDYVEKEGGARRGDQMCGRRGGRVRGRRRRGRRRGSGQEGWGWATGPGRRPENAGPAQGVNRDTCWRGAHSCCP